MCVAIGSKVFCKELGNGLVCETYTSDEFNSDVNTTKNVSIADTVYVVFENVSKVHSFQYNEEREKYYDILSDPNKGTSEIIYLTILN